MIGLGERPAAKRLSRKSHMEILWVLLDVGSGQNERGRKFSLTPSLSLKYPHVKEKAAVLGSAICALPEATQLGPS